MTPPVGCYRSIDPSCFYKEILLCFNGTYKVSFRDAHLFPMNGYWKASDGKQPYPFLFYDLVVKEKWGFCRRNIFFHLIDADPSNHLVIALSSDTHAIFEEIEGFFSCHYQDGTPIYAGDMFFHHENLCTVTGVLGIDNRDAVPSKVIETLQDCGYRYGCLFESPFGLYVFDSFDEDMVLFRRAD